MEAILFLLRRKLQKVIALVERHKIPIIASACALLTAAALLMAILIFRPRGAVVLNSSQAKTETSSPDLSELLDEIAVAKRTQQEQDEVIRLLRADFEAAMKELAANYDLLSKQGANLDAAIKEVHTYLRSTPTTSSSPSAASTTGQTSSSQKVNLNTADKTALMTLPGIGATYADRILAYRQEHGSFARKEDIQQVSGIGPATYAKLQDLIEV